MKEFIVTLGLEKAEAGRFEKTIRTGVFFAATPCEALGIAILKFKTDEWLVATFKSIELETARRGDRS